MLGLTLEGGGGKGAYQIGAWKAFRELNMEFEGISGTSVGALNGALMIQDEFELAYEIWHEMTPNRVLDVDDRIYEMLASYDIKTTNFQLLANEIKKTIKGHGLDTSPLNQLIYNHVKEEKIRSSSKDFGFVTVSVTDYKPMEIYKEQVPIGKMGDYLIASSYLPVFKSNKLDGKIFLDGGFYDNLPVDMLYQKGYKKIIAVRLFGKGRIKKVEYPDLEVTYIVPKKPLGSILDFSQERARINLKLGYLDTLKVFQKLRGRNYYLSEGVEEAQAFAYFTQLTKETLQKLADLFRLSSDRALNRLLFEEIIPKLAGLLELEKGAGYGEIIEALLETAAEMAEVPLYQTYPLEDFLYQIHQREDRIQQEDFKFKNSFIPSEWIKRLDKDKILKAAVYILISDSPLLTEWKGF